MEKSLEKGNEKKLPETKELKKKLKRWGITYEKNHTLQKVKIIGIFVQL